MSDLNWCSYCDKAISICSNSLYCSEYCFKSDGLKHHPSLGYGYAKLKVSPRLSISSSISSSSALSESTSSPLLAPFPSGEELSIFSLSAEEKTLHRHMQTQQTNLEKRKSRFVNQQVFLHY